MFKKQPFCYFCSYVAQDEKEMMRHLEICEKHPAHQWAVDRDCYKRALEAIYAREKNDDRDAPTVLSLAGSALEIEL
jgi:hypothetical protein